ncbi:MAG: hypothetical protein AB7I25_14365 [Vicinamibacterales bacterium]
MRESCRRSSVRSFFRCVAAATVAALLVARPAPAAAWGIDAHKFIMDRAIALLPDALRPFFEKHRASVVERAIDPDTWRTAGFTDEPPNHFVDIDWEGYGPYPFKGLPRDYTAAVAKFGKAKIVENGTLPWRVEEYYGNLQRAFEAYGKRPHRGTALDVVLLSAAMCHYVGDAHQPFHAVISYDGQATNQRGIHARFESELYDRYSAKLTITPKPIAPIVKPRDFIFDTLIEGTTLTKPILAADLKALGGRDVYDDAYFDAFLSGTRPILERRLGEAIAATAAMLTGAWEAAGRPAAPAVPPPQPPQRKRP